MKIGLMNNPRSEIREAIEFIASNGFDYVDLTLEHPRAHLDVIDRKEVLESIRQSGLGVIGHTAWYLPIGSAVTPVRDAAVADIIRSLDFFREAGDSLVTVHPDAGRGAVEPATTQSLNALSFKIMSDRAAKMGMQIMVENTPGAYSSFEGLKSIFDRVPGLGFHLDVGHAFVRRRRLNQLLSAFKDRLTHVHLSDNRGREDDHLPLGAGNIDWEQVIKALKTAGYDGTFTIEVFSQDPRYVLASRDKLRELWKGHG
jgi:sugar phosphate isomerase/epimerase